MYRKLEKTVKTKWLKALTSGKFKQGSGKLVEESYTEDLNKLEVVGHCCLGVLADVKGKLADSGKGVEYSPEFIDNYGNDDDIKGFDTSCRLGGNQKLSRESGYVPAGWVDPKAQKVLSELNDKGTPFKTIAKWIDKHL